MKFHFLHEGFYEGVQLRFDQLKTASERLDVEFVALDSLTIDYSKLPVLSETDFLYNAARGSETLETILLNENVTTFYVNNPKFVVANSDTTKYSILHQKAGISEPKTIFNPRNNRLHLKSYIDFIGGFPVVLKTKNGTLGIGTIIAKDFETLFSVADYLTSTNTEFIIRQFIKPKEVARLIVVGNKVVASNQKFVVYDDFRTSVKHRLPSPKKYPIEIEEMAVKASHLINFENTGVDIIFDENNIPYLLEVNMPHDFTTTARVSGIDISKLMVEHLITKIKKA
jgi:glutathione synthase/RimK-type ligase-like ATP-grasp enzyme